MFVTNHVLAGAAIGSLLRHRPGTAFAAGFVSHLGMDACPHWGMVVDGPQAEQRFLDIARCDGCLGLAAMAAATILASHRIRTSTVMAMLGAALPDIDKPAMHFFGSNPFPERFQRFHSRIQRESPSRLRQEVLTGALLAVVTGVWLRQEGRRRS